MTCHEASAVDGMGLLTTSFPGTADSILARIQHFFLEWCEPPCNEIAPESHPEGTQPVRTLWTQEVDCMRLLSCCAELGGLLFTSPLILLDILRTECASLCTKTGQPMTPSDLSIRLTHLPNASIALPSLPPQCGELVTTCGSIVRMCTKRVVPFVYRLMCPRCRAVTEAYSNPMDRAAQRKDLCQRKECKSEELQVVGRVWMDYAECRLQQRSGHSGKLPRSILVTLDDELSTKCTVGQFVEVVGLLFPKWRHVYPLSRPTVEPAIWAINVLPMEAYRGAAVMGAPTASRRKANRQTERPKFSPDGYFKSFCKNKRKRGVSLVRSVCAQLAGLWGPRLAILLAALGGASNAGKASMHIRSTIHCLLVGDPSTGKSQLLRYGAAVAPRSTSTTGMGSTAAGLTVAATKEQGEWVLEPGALVLSDGGSCIIDELRMVSTTDRASLHEAMEQQTISVAKAGLVMKLRTACSVLAACNPPPRRGDHTEVGVGSPLLSRFDFIFLLWDTPRPDLDEHIAEHILSCSVYNQKPEAPLATDEMARYLWWVRGQYANVDGPLLSDGAADFLARYYEIQRQRGASPALDDAVPVTVRFLESLVRVAQAHAKLHLQSVCTLDDAAMAVFLMERTAHTLKCPLGSGLYSSSSELDNVFLSDSPESIEQQEAVLEALVQTVRQYRLSVPEQQIGEELSELRNSGGNEIADDDTLLSLRKRPPSFFVRDGLENTSPSNVAGCAQELEREVNTSFCTPRTVVKYPAAALASPGSSDPRVVLDSHRLSRRTSSQAGPASTSAEVVVDGVDPVVPSEEDVLLTSGSAQSSQTHLPSPPVVQTAISSLFSGNNPPVTPPSQVSAPLTMTGKRKRTAEDIMRSLRFHR